MDAAAQRRPLGVAPYGRRMVEFLNPKNQEEVPNEAFIEVDPTAGS